MLSFSVADARAADLSLSEFEWALKNRVGGDGDQRSA